MAAPGRRPLTYVRLASLVEGAAASLRRLGVRGGDRVALVGPNGPEMAAAFLAITTVGSCAPLNPVYRAEEFAFYLEDLRASTLVIAEGAASAATAVAQRLGLRIIEMKPDAAAAAGEFTFRGDPATVAFPERQPDPEEEALVLHTSGTTSRPKLVPLTHRNLVTSARQIGASLELTPQDRCLNVMPLFHVHGLVAALLASLEAGGSVACCPGLGEFFKWAEEMDPTWYTAVPAIHQAVLREARQRGDWLARHRLRFIRSGSAALAPALMAALESAFGAPVIEAYGMTEAAHQIASNPLPPHVRKPGSVGVATGTELAVIDESGRLLDPGQTGEVVIRGPNVTAGYDNNPEANSRAFTNGWFRTGDQGYLDSEGYLFLTGRLKELINRAGEKIAPREIDEVLVAHPAVAQAAAFAVPHSKLGEAVAAAVVLEGDADESELRGFAAQRLAPFKVPERVFTVETLPKGPTGKLQRAGLAEKLGVTELDLRHAGRARRFEQPTSKREAELARCFGEVLCRKETPGIHDDFFDALGGDSLAAATLLVRVEEETGIAIAPERFFANATVAGLAAALEDVAPAPAGDRFLVAIRPAGELAPLICVPGAHGNLAGFYHLARYLRRERPVYGLRLPPASGRFVRYRVEDLAEAYMEEWRTAGRQGPCAVLGVCSGSPVALEIAQRLSAAGQPVVLTAMLDSYNLTALRRLTAAETAVLRWKHFEQRITYHWNHLRRTRPAGAPAYLMPRWRAFWRERGEAFGQALYGALAATGRPLPRALQGPTYACRDAVSRYEPHRWSGRALLFRVQEPRDGAYDIEAMGWQDVFAGGVEVREVPGSHLTALREPHVAGVAGFLEEALAE